MKKIAGLVFVLLVQWAAAQNIIYVDALATGNNTGTSWGNAYPDLQLGLEAAQYGDEIWVARATYFPSKDTGNTANPGDPRRKYFCLLDGVGIYGGFDGTETQRSQRDWLTNFTVLSGDLGVKGDSSDNSYHVVASINDNLGPESILDGFIVEKGNADWNSFIDSRYGGGVHIWGPSRAVLKNLIIRDNIGNSGGGLGFVDSLDGKLKSGYISVVNCRIRNNHSTYRGGGMFLYQNRANFVNCLISGNLASGVSSATGGAIYTTYSKTRFFNCTEVDNYGTNVDGTFIWNTLDFGVYNSILVGYIDVDYTSSSILQNCKYQNSIASGKGLDLGGNMDTLPGFVDSNNYRLQYSSPARDAGLDSLLPNDVADLDEDGDTSETIPFDILNRPRINSDRVDIGAFEYYPLWADSSSYKMCPGGQTTFNGQVIDSAGTYERLISSTPNGDSVEYFTVVMDLTNTNVIVDSTGKLVSRQDSGRYQWVYCAQSNPVGPGDTLQSFTPRENGFYKVIVTNSNGCIDTSGCFHITDVSLKEKPLNNNFGLYPNPASDELILKTENVFPTGTFDVQVFDLSGKEVYRQRFDHYREKEINIPLHNLKIGIYALKISEEVLWFVKE